MLTVYIAVIKSLYEYFLNLFDQRFGYLYDEMQQNGSKSCNSIVLESDQTFVTFHKPVVFFSAAPRLRVEQSYQQFMSRYMYSSF